MGQTAGVSGVSDLSELSEEGEETEGRRGERGGGKAMGQRVEERQRLPETRELGDELNPLFNATEIQIMNSEG